MQNKILFDDTNGSGWCVGAGASFWLGASAVYAIHVTCTRTQTLSNLKDSGERWSWFVDDIPREKDEVHVCFECGEAVPDHIQALVVLQAPMEVSDT